MTTAVIVQARAGSTRLPGKVLLPLGRGTILAEVLRRCAAIPGIDIVCCAVPDLPADDRVAEEAARCGARVVRGSEKDVLDRYAKAARAIGADIVMRITSDCPLIDPAVCGEVLALVAEKGVDYACNDMPGSFPHGLDCEVFTRALLERAWNEARRPEEREHVTPWMRNAPDVRRANLDGPGAPASEQRWTLDFPEDYALLKEVVELLPPPPAIPPWREVAAVVDRHADIRRLNAARVISRSGP